MQRVHLVLFSLTCLTLFGCNKSHQEAAAPDPPAGPVSQAATPARAEDKRPAIVTFGDSLSEGFGAPPGQSFPDFLQKELDAAGYEYRIVNMGISGDTTTGGVNRIQSAIDARPEILILELGGNDGLRGVPISSTRSNLEQMITAFKDAGIRVVLAGMSLPPNYGADYIRQFEAMYKDLAARHKLTLIPFLLEDIANQINNKPSLLQRDGIHPTAEGNQLVAKTVMKTIRPILER